jgi:ribulose bisphosphate carboxylase small subunit
MTYREEAIAGALRLLNQIEVKGIDNARRIVMIEQILQHPEGEEAQDGNEKENR